MEIVLFSCLREETIEFDLMEKTNEIIVLSEKVNTLEGSWIDGEPYVTSTDVEKVLGWQVKLEGLCRGDVCIPIDDGIVSQDDNSLNLKDVAALAGRPSLSAPEAGIITIGQPHAVRSKALKDHIAPDFKLPDISGVDRALSDWSGKKRLLVAFSSW